MDKPPEKASLFSARILRPSVTRAPAYDDLEPRSREFRFDCAKCGSSVRIDLGAIIAEDARVDSILGPENAAAIRAHFDFNTVGKSHDGGWPRLHVERCRRCGTRYLIYVGVKEPSNSRFLVTMQGITQLSE
jgi:DNA-directed RNA polymerase subunit RPC12/RpoP